MHHKQVTVLRCSTGTSYGEERGNGLAMARSENCGLQKTPGEFAVEVRWNTVGVPVIVAEPESSPW